MDTLSMVLKCLTILIVNIGIGCLICVCLHFFLFYPRKVMLFNRFALPLTPGIVHRKKKDLIVLLKKLIDDYFIYVSRDVREINFLTGYERKVYHQIYPSILNYVQKSWIPKFIKNRLYGMISSLSWMLVRKFSRYLLPKILNGCKVYTKLELLDLKLDVYKIKAYFDKHIYNTIVKASIAFFTIIGLMNMLMFIALYY